MIEGARLEDLLSEHEVYDRYGKLLAERELREARKNREIGWYDLRKGPHYTPAQIMDYLKLRECQPCQPNQPLDADKPVPGPQANGKRNGSSRSGLSGSDAKPTATISSIAGMTTTLEERAARRLDSEI